MTLTVGELFAGYGGLGRAAEEVFGARLAWYSEFDPAPSAIMAHHWPDVPNLHFRRLALPGPVRRRTPAGHDGRHQVQPVGRNARGHRGPKTALCHLGERKGCVQCNSR